MGRARLGRTVTEPDSETMNVGSAPQEVSTVGTIGSAGYACPTGQYTGHPTGAPFQTGDDASYAGAVATLSYTVNGDGTITDNNTGLMWVIDPSVLGVSWGTPGTPTAVSWGDGITMCESLSYAGYNDWKMPDIKELMTIVDCQGAGPYIDVHFTNIQSAEYWSSTTNPGDTSEAMTVDFGEPWTDFGSKTMSTEYVIPCRRV